MFCVDAKELRKAVKEVAKLATKRSPIQRLLLRTEDGALSLSAYDGSRALTVRVPASVYDSAAFCLDARRVIDVIPRIKAHDIQAEMRSGMLRLRFNDWWCDFDTEPVSYYEKMPMPSGEPLVTLTAEQWQRVLDTSTVARNVNPKFPEIIRGIHFIVTPARLTAMATDAYRAAIYHDVIENGRDAKFTVPVDGIRLAASWKKRTVRLYLDEKNFIAASDHGTLVLPLMEGDYPYLPSTVPGKYRAGRFQVLKEDIVASLKQLSAVDDTVRIKQVDSRIILSAIPEKGNAASITLGATVEHDVSEVAFDIKYLTEACELQKGSQVVLEFSSQYGAARITSKDDITFVYYLMPKLVY